MAAYATPDHVADQWRPLTDQEVYAATVLLNRVSALIRLGSPGLDARLVTDPDLALVVSGIAVDAVLRVLRNPDGKVQEAIDDYSYRRADAVADGVLYVTDREFAQLAPSTGPSSRGAFTIRPGPAPAGPFG
jgi:Phage protein Gp19/Gp15/Gp42